jgi:hypothetical protein
MRGFTTVYTRGRRFSDQGDLDTGRHVVVLGPVFQQLTARTGLG